MPDISYGHLVTVNPWVRRMTAPNPGPLTGQGTNTYVVGHKRVAVIDPGPLENGHADILYRQLTEQGCTIAYIIVTHTHLDHSPASRRLAQLSGAPQIGLVAEDCPFQDQQYRADEDLFDGWILETEEFALEAIFTPGHVNNHFCLLEKNSGLLMAGDHLMNGSTVVILPPSGDMFDYVNSLKKLQYYAIKLIAPAHGDVMENPAGVLAEVIEHRLQRERKVIAALAGNGELTLAQLVLDAYDDVAVSKHSMAMFSLHAHLLKLQREDRVEQRGDAWWMAAQ